MSEYTDAVARGMQGMEAVSSGTCQGCSGCAEDLGFDYSDHGSRADFQRQVETGVLYHEPSFSWRPCGVCGSSLGGNREVWHWIDPNDPLHQINHEHDMCADCVLYLANGDEPESWRQR